MSLDVYGTHLNGLDLSDQEKAELIDIIKAIAENIINDLFERSFAHGNNW